MTSPSERVKLETCLAAAKRQLDMCRLNGQELQAALVEADLNRMLERLRELTARKVNT